MAESSEKIAEKIKEIRMQIKHGYVVYKGHYLLPENQRYLQGRIPAEMGEHLYEMRKENFPPRLIR